MDSNQPESSPWKTTIPPKKSIFLDFSPETTLKITSMEFSSVESDEPSQITANVNSLLTPDENSKDDKCDISNNNQITFGTLIPNETNKVEIYFQFSPLDIVEVHNSGPNEVQLSGCLESIDSEFENIEEEEEEDKGEEVQEVIKEEIKEEVFEEHISDPDTIQSRFSEMAANQPPKPQRKNKKKKNKKKKKDNDDDDDNDENGPDEKEANENDVDEE